MAFVLLFAYIWTLPGTVFTVFTDLLMLRIGDIHITSKWGDTIIDELRWVIKKCPQEKSIIFFGDYVYHFNYDRKALLALFSFFLSLYQEGKYVYVLAGNHDRIADNFVFAEAKKAFDILWWWEKQKDLGLLKFISSAEIISIEGKDCLFFPFGNITQEEFSTQHFDHLLTSSHAKERLSGKANSLLGDMIHIRREDHPWEELLVFHHRYIVNTQFPWLWARFSYKSSGLDPSFCSLDHIRLVSGHLHQSFAWEHYLCLWSIWFTSPLETNQQKYIFRYDGTSNKVYALPLAIHPYLEIDIVEGKFRDRSWFLHHLEEIKNKSYHSLQAGDWQVVSEDDEFDFPFTSTILSCVAEKVSYADLSQYVDQEMLDMFQEVKIKRKKQDTRVLYDQLQDASLELDKSISDRKGLLSKYLDLKYGDKSEMYHDLLREMDLL